MLHSYRHLRLLASVLVVASFSLLGTACHLARPSPAPAVAVAVADSLARLHPAAPWLAPAPAGSTPRQLRQWQRAQRTAMVRASTGPRKIKLVDASKHKDQRQTKTKDVGNLRTVSRLKVKDQRKIKPRQKTVVRQGLAIKSALGIGALGVAAGLTLLGLYRRRNRQRAAATSIT